MMLAIGGAQRTKRLVTAAVLIVVMLACVRFAVALSQPTTVTNLTPSMPLGLYVTRPAPAPSVGMVATVDVSGAALRRARELDSALPVDGGHSQLLKVVVGVPGERYRVNARGIYVSGVLLTASAPLAGVRRASSGIVPPGAVLAWSPVRASLDSRYLGPLPLIAQATPKTAFSARDSQRLRPKFSVDESIGEAGR